jgi:very-short-patch-repair endonuclease
MTMSGLVPRVHTVIGDIEVDFSLEGHGFRLAIEVDGRIPHQHSTQADGSRDAFLLAKGWDVLRVPARDVLQTPSEVLHLIRARLGPASQEMDPLRRYHKDDS